MEILRSALQMVLLLAFSKYFTSAANVTCMPAILTCRRDNTQLAYDGLPEQVRSPSQLKQHCSTKSYSSCLRKVILASCSKLESLNVLGEIKAEEYICTEEALNMYAESNEFNQHPWMVLRKYYMKDESKMCREKFLDKTHDYFYKYQGFKSEKEALVGEGKEVNKYRTQLQEWENSEMNNYCNYMYVYQECVEFAAKRHCNESISTWQYEVLAHYYTPHFEYVGCHIGKGMQTVTIVAIVIVTVVLGLIFLLACFCGVYEKCFERINEYRRRHHDDGEPLADPEDNSRSDKTPGKNGSKVRFS